MMPYEVGKTFIRVPLLSIETYKNYVQKKMDYQLLKPRKH